MNIKPIKIRQLHRLLAPIMILPILFTVITGVIYQIGELGGFEDNIRFIIHWHKGNFGYIDFQKSFPFLNGLGSLILAITGLQMWFKPRRSSNKSS
ncbi:MAG: PepSY domain-containing protein [Xenococcaceae cyanobacterium MO_167.B52]|nr:PepSY domain-containing protein [Xenococcaceae cyanobacterium MO_167.B52]